MCLSMGLGNVLIFEMCKNYNIYQMYNPYLALYLGRDDKIIHNFYGQQRFFRSF
eukprot:UN21374